MMHSISPLCGAKTSPTGGAAGATLPTGIGKETVIANDSAVKFKDSSLRNKDPRRIEELDFISIHTVVLHNSH